MDFSVLNTTANITTIQILDYKNEDFRNTVHRWELTEFENYNRRTELEMRSIMVNMHSFLLDNLNKIGSIHIFNL